MTESRLDVLYTMLEELREQNKKKQSEELEMRIAALHEAILICEKN